MILPESIQNLINALERLPGIGPKSASRLAFYLLKAPEDVSERLADALREVKANTGLCTECFNITSGGHQRCSICENDRRDAGQICVVEEPLDVIALEKVGIYNGKYHVLHGVLSPIEGIGPDDLRLAPLFGRLERGGVRELILATNPSMEGDATAIYIQQKISKMALESPLQITRLARGLPVGGDLEYADQNTLMRALAGRQEMN
ncbi:MAG TPA: recombination mediator RecR [Anaerolineales bacterium]|nr:recombination mediator RecR [Anaerolineales bacterium]